MNRSHARAAVAERVQRALRRAGYELHRYPPAPEADPEERRRARLLRARGIDLVLDVGANEGQYAQRLRAAGYRGRIVSFEPGPDAHARLAAAAAADPLWETSPLALGDRDGEAELNVAGNSYSSSLLPIGERHLESAPDSAYVAAVPVRSARLESVWRDHVRDGERVWLKLDVQGYELHVLRGAQAVIPEIDTIQAEMSFVHLYEGDVTWRTLVDWLEERGFRLAGVEAGFEDSRTGELLQADGIFVRSGA